MSDCTKQQMFALTPIWLWPVLWFSLRSYERWLHAYWSKHGFCEVICRLSRFGTVHVHRIYPPEPEQTSLTGAHISRFEQRIYADALTPDDVISQPVRKVSEARHARKASAFLGARLLNLPFVQIESIRDGPADTGSNKNSPERDPCEAVRPIRDQIDNTLSAPHVSVAIRGQTNMHRLSKPRERGQTGWLHLRSII